MAHAHETQAKISLLKKTLFAGRNATPASFGGRRGGKCAILALLFCVCGAASATDYYVYTNSTASIVTIPFNRNTSWKIKNGTSYADTQSYPTSGDSAYFGAGTADASAPNIRSSTAYNIPIPTGGVNIAGAYIYLSDNTSNTQIYFSSGNEFTIKEKFEIRQATGLSNIDIQLNLVDIARNSSPVNIKIPSGMTITVGSGGTATINGNIVIESGGKLVVNGTLNATSITNNAGGTINIGNSGKIEGKITNDGTFTNAGTLNLNDGTFANTATGIWYNTGTVNVTSGDFTNNGGRINENGTWQYNANRTGIADIRYNELKISTGANVRINNNLVATSILMAPLSKLDLVNYAMYTDGIQSSGTISLYGTQEIKNVAGINWAVIQEIAEVEFYENTGSTKIEVSKMAGRLLSSVDFTKIKCDLSGGNDAKVLDFTGVRNIGTLELKGNSTNKLGITANAPTTINITGKAEDASNLRVDYNNVILTGNECDLTDGTSVDFAGNAAYGLHNGWRFPPTPSVYYWVGGSGNWSEYRTHWRYGSPNGSPATEAPGTNRNAEVHIEPTVATTVTLDVSLDGSSGNGNPITSITLNNNATFNIGNSNLTVTGTWTNGSGSVNGTPSVVTVTAEGGRIQIAGNHRQNSPGTGHVVLPADTKDFGTWEYRNTELRDVVEKIVVYNKIECAAANVGRTVVNSFVAREINLSNGTLRLGCDNETPQYAMSNVNVTVENMRVSGGSGWFSVNGTNNITITNQLDHSGNRFVFQDGTLTAKTINCGSYFQMRGTNNPKFNIGTFNYTGGTVEFPANAVINGYNGAGSNTQITNNGNLAFGNAITINGNVTNNNARTLMFRDTATINGTLTNDGIVNFDSSATITTLTNNVTKIITFAGATPTIDITSGTNFGTVNIAGNPSGTANVANSNTSTVNYQLTAANEATVNFGNTYGTLTCKVTTAGKTLKFNGTTTVNRNLTLSGTDTTNSLAITSDNPTANIVLTTNNTSHGEWLNIDYDNVNINNASAFTPFFDVTRNCFDKNGNAQYGLLNGWKFRDSNVYYWVGGTSNWNVPSNWRYGRIDGGVAAEYPGAKTDAEVHIEPASATPPTNATVTLNVSSLSISKITIDNNGTLELGANNLSVRGTDTNSWTNRGKVTVTSGNVMFTVSAIDSGEWTYNNTADRSLINLTYNDLNLNGTNTNTITPIDDVSARGKITISSATTFDLASRNLSAATIENKGTVRLHGTQTVSTTPANISNATTSTVEFYNNTGNTAIDISKMGTGYGNLIVNGYNKTLAFPTTTTTTVAGNLILKGANDNAPLTITTNAASATINVTNSQQSNEGQYLRIDRAKVTISGSSFGNPTCSYYAKNSYDTEETTDAALLPVRNGWKIDIPIHLTNMLLSVAPLGGNTVYVRAVQTTMDGLSGVPSGLIANMLKRFFKIYESTSPAAGITVTNASLVRNSSKVTWIRLSLSGLGGITVADLQKYYVRTYTNDPSAGSTEGFHPISDFAVGAVNPLFAYDNRYADSDANWQSSAVSSGVAVRNWDADQGNTGSLLSKKDIVMSVRVASGVGTPVLHLSSNPTAGSQSGQYNSDTNSNWRIWLPDVTGLAALAGNTNTNTIDTTTGSINVTGGGANPIFNIPASNNSSYSSWKDGDQITFMFGVTDATNAAITVGGPRGTTSHPLYALRLRNAGDINSLDLWSFRLRSMTAQRGGVSIRNNVINIATGEQVAIEVDMPKSGTLNVMIMTLDGSIVKYLQHGTTSAGKHVYHWGGLTNSSSPVARGLYFIRIVGSGIDETRKVMVVK